MSERVIMRTRQGMRREGERNRVLLRAIIKRLTPGADQ